MDGLVISVLSLTLLGGVLGWLLGLAARYLKVEAGELESEIEQMLPGSQCGQCGYPGCAPAAAAIASGSAAVTICPPGGRALAEELAAKLGVSVDLSDMDESVPKIAHIHEQLCIGCTKCFKRCPTDAILGASKMIHAVFSDACTGCEKCFDVCPTECIEMREVKPTVQTWYWHKPDMAA